MTTVKAKQIEILGSNMHYVEQGVGKPILFLHGMPTSSHLWRNVMPALAPLGRCIAVDLIGMGRSDKPDIDYTIEDHIRYINHFIEALALKDITLVMHGWGSIIGFDYAMRHESNCKGLAFYEAYLRPVSLEDISLPLQEQIMSLDEHGESYDFVMNGIDFIDKVLPQEMMFPLSEAEMMPYREPFFEDGAGKPLAQYYQELPRGNEECKVNAIIAAYSKKLICSSLPKLMMYTLPGFITTMATAMWAKEHLKHLELADIGEELHFAPESNPGLMGDTISAWLQAIE